VGSGTSLGLALSVGGYRSYARLDDCLWGRAVVQVIGAHSLIATKVVDESCLALAADVAAGGAENYKLSPSRFIHCG
jgi:hypothetical protein